MAERKRDELKKTNYKGVYTYVHPEKGKTYVARFMLKGKSFKREIGRESDGYTPRRAYAVKERWLEEVSQGKNVRVRGEKSLNELFALYIEAARAVNSPSWAQIKSYLFNSYFREPLGDRNVSTLKVIDLQRVINNALFAGKSPQTALHLKNVIAKVLDYGVKTEMIQTNPARLVETPKFDNAVENHLDPEEEKRLFKTIIQWPEPLYRGIFTFLLHGRRKNEVLKLRRKHIDLERMEYAVPAEQNKARKTMHYAITDLLEPVVLEALEGTRKEEDLLFPSLVTGDVIVNLTKPWERVKRESGIEKPFRLHDLRHLIGNLGVNEAGLTNDVVAAILGHTSTRVTKRYARVRAEVAGEGIHKIHQLLRT